MCFLTRRRLQPPTPRAVAAVSVRVDGASGDCASVVNGVFALEEELYNGRALYRKVGDPHWWLRFTPGSWWVISDTVDKDANNNAGYAYSSSRGLSLPTDSSVWEVFVDGKSVKQAAMRVQPASEQVGARLGARVSVSHVAYHSNEETQRRGFGVKFCLPRILC